MKPTAHDKTISPATNRTRAGMTLIEVMIAAALMMVIVAGVMSAHFLGLRESQLLESKAGVNDTARRAVNQLLQDIRAAKGYDIGTMSGTNFTLITNGILQGAGLKLYSVVISTNQAVDPNKYLIYYFDSNHLASANGMLWRMNSTSGVPAVTVSSGFTASIPSSRASCRRNALTSAMSTRAPRARATNATRMPMGPPPITAANSPSFNSLMRTSWQATATGSTMAPSRMASVSGSR